MIANESCHGDGVTTPRHASRATAFTLIELLTVVFIISLLIGLLIPSINAARNAAKKLTTSKTIDAIKVGLEMFKNDNGPDFRQTNGYPPSFAHPPIPGYSFQPHLGQFPFLDPVSNGNPPTVYGAHWLPALLMGADHLGLVKRSTVPKKDNLRSEPWRWYAPDPLNEGRPLERQPLYLDPGNVKTLATEKLPGKRPESSTDPPIFPNWDNMRKLPVIVDAFDQPILYYVANTHGQVTNMVGDGRNENNIYSGGNQERGVPFYFHQDNIGFTGDTDNTKLGWDFGGRKLGPEGLIRDHAISRSGADLIGSEIAGPANRETFARYIVDRKVYESLFMNLDTNAPVRPVNADSYLLISAGPDGVYGTNDDVNNMPPWPD